MKKIALILLFLMILKLNIQSIWVKDTIRDKLNDIATKLPPSRPFVPTHEDIQFIKNKIK